MVDITFCPNGHSLASFYRPPPRKKVMRSMTNQGFHLNSTIIEGNLGKVT